MKLVRFQGQFKGIFLPCGKQSLNVHFANNSIVTPKPTQSFVEGKMNFLDIYARVASAMDSQEKIETLFIGKDVFSNGLVKKWKILQLG